MLKEYNRLESLAIQIQKEVDSLPPGKLTICSNSPTKASWYNSDGKNRIYIPKKDRRLAESLAYKKYLISKLEDIAQEISAIHLYLDNHREESSNKLISSSPEFKKLLSANFVPLNQELDDWMLERYKKNEQYPEYKIHKTCTGEMVRSKSEAFIYTCLCNHKIPFRYECELWLGEIVFYPDFTIRHPKTGKQYYWEHLGLMDKPEYIHRAYNKLDVYGCHGIVPTINLITTYETKGHPLSIQAIENLIKEYFL